MMINVGNMLKYALPIAQMAMPLILNNGNDIVCSEQVGDMRPALPINAGNITEVLSQPSNAKPVVIANTPKVLVKANIEVYIANDGVNYAKANEISFDKSFAVSEGNMSLI